MPTYEYVCLKCDQRFELVQSIKDDPIATCPKDLCLQKRWGKGKVKRAIGAGGGLIFKGSGFYITDYRSDKYKEAAKKDVAPVASTGSASAKPASEGGKPAAAKSESKPASTAKSSPDS